MMNSRKTEQQELKTGTIIVLKKGFALSFRLTN